MNRALLDVLTAVLQFERDFNMGNELKIQCNGYLNTNNYMFSPFYALCL